MGAIGGHRVEPGRRVIGVVNGEPVYAPLQAADIGAVTDADVTAAIAGKLDANTPITPATKTKITYDADGLVTAGADATTADIADSANKRYVTDAQQVVIGNTSGTNTGDQTSVSGNAGTATALQTARTINGVSFDGTASIQNTLASANFANQGTATTVLHGNAAGNPAFGAVVEADQTLADNTTNDVSTAKHGYAPKAPNDATKFLDGTGAYDTVKDSDLATTDITTGDVSITKHGFAPKAPNDAAKFLNGAGAYAVPAGTGAPTDATYITQTPNGTLSAEQALSSLATGIVKVTTATGVLSTATDGTDYLSPASGEKWDVVATLAADFTVTNAVLQDVTGFTGAITTGLVYEVEVIGADSANDITGDIAVALAATGTWTVLGSWFEGVIHSASSGNAVVQGVTAFASTTLSTASPGLTIDHGDGATRPFRLRYFFACSGNGNAKLQMGNVNAAAGRTSTLKTGTTFRLRRVG